MGISGLLPALASITNDFHISSLSGLRAAIDIFCWLHKGVYACSQELCLGQPTEKYISYCMHRIKLLQAHNVTPVVVFDGGPLPAKADTERERRKTREEARARGVEHLRNGNLGQARDCFNRAVDITSEMAYKLIKELKRSGVEFVVAPYEADAQMAHLALTGYVDAVITEDSDLLAYGCPRVIFKMDKFGQGREIRFGDLGSSENPSFVNFTIDMFRHTCIMAGCDYLDSIPGLGIKKAHGFMKKYKSVERVLEVLEATRSHAVPADYFERFQRADLTFRFHRVFDPRRNVVVHLNDPSAEDDPDQWDFLGPSISDELGREIARGLVDPHSKQAFAAMFGESPAAAALDRMPAQRVTERRRSPVKSSPTMQKNTLSNYFTPAPKSVTKPFMPPRATPTSAPARSPIKRGRSPFTAFTSRFSSSSISSTDLTGSDESPPIDADAADADGDVDDCVMVAATYADVVRESPPGPHRAAPTCTTPSKRQRVLPPPVIAPKTPSPPGVSSAPTTIVVSKHFAKGPPRKPAVRQILNDSDTRSPLGSPVTATPGSGSSGVFVSPFVAGSRLSFTPRTVSSSFRMSASAMSTPIASTSSSRYFSSQSNAGHDSSVLSSPPSSARSTPAAAVSAKSADKFAQHLQSFAYQPKGALGGARGLLRGSGAGSVRVPMSAPAAAPIVINDDDDDCELEIIGGPDDPDDGSTEDAPAGTSESADPTPNEDVVSSDDELPEEPHHQDQIEDDAEEPLSDADQATTDSTE
eukprot:TRINITY_DN3410_c0_g1_i3.p1 TRINITY_DN3410_c0_g1~~TRINITY_DN3410_c0_g1_i3.p1  ORF type:complete len:756 (-),score=230.11 TRINITY_DN3410_c0_g1_i3:137-2404(-)